MTQSVNHKYFKAVKVELSVKCMKFMFIKNVYMRTYRVNLDVCYLLLMLGSALSLSRHSACPLLCWVAEATPFAMLLAAGT